MYVFGVLITRNNFLPSISIVVCPVNRTVTLFLHPLLKGLYRLHKQTICTWVVRCRGNVLDAIFLQK